MKSLLLLTFLASSLVFAETKTIPVSGMTCGGCVSSVKKSICEGLKYSKENCEVKVGELKVTGDKIDMAAIETALKKDGFEIASSTPATATTEAKPATATKKK